MFFSLSLYLSFFSLFLSLYIANAFVYSLRRYRMVISLIAQTDCENVQMCPHKDARCDDSGERKREREEVKIQRKESVGNGRLLPTNSGF